jgi:phosphate-selective porin
MRGQAPSPTPVTTPTPEAAKNEPVNYIFPDIPNPIKFNRKYLSFNFSLAMFGDYTGVSQDAASISQVGHQPNKMDLRAARFVFFGLIKFKRPWSYLFAYDYNELRKDGDQVFDRLDASVTIPLWKKARVTLGKTKEPFIYEMVGDAATISAQERILTPFFQSRNVGIRYLDNYLKDRMTLSIGVYNDWAFNPYGFKKSGTQVAGRVTGLPIEKKHGREYLHLGLGLRYNGADDGTMRFKGRPESNTIGNYVDTGNFAAKYAKQLGLEFLYNRGPFSVLSEYTQAWVSSPQKGDPSFNGFYVVGSYVLTGENRPYDKKVGYTRRIIPKSRWGAVELVGRFSYVDLDDRLVHGGQLKKWYAGANWWASRQWKLGLGYGNANLDKANTSGRTQMIHTRVQWMW